MWRISLGQILNRYSAMLCKQYRVYGIFAWFNTTRYLSDVFISEPAKALVQVFHHSERSNCGKSPLSATNLNVPKVPPVLLAITTKGCALVTPVAPLGFTSNLAKVLCNVIIFHKNCFDGILLETGEETVSRVRVAWVLRKVELIHLHLISYWSFFTHPMILDFDDGSINILGKGSCLLPLSK